MRIVHDIDGPTQVAIGGQPYGKPKDAKHASSFRTEMTFVIKNPLSAGDDEIHIEGNATYILGALKYAVDVLEAMGEGMVEDGIIGPNWARAGEKVPGWARPTDEPSEEKNRRRRGRQRRRAASKKKRKKKST